MKPEMIDAGLWLIALACGVAGFWLVFGMGWALISFPVWLLVCSFAAAKAGEA
jgi:hypothetical protein